jgi:hypothetical protein
MKTIPKKGILLLIIIFIFIFSIFSYCLAQKTEKTASSKDLKQTVITPVLEKYIPENKNVIYCSSFQLAWNELRDNMIKETIRLENPPNYLDFLNKSDFSSKDLSPESYLALVGYKKDGITKKIKTELKRKFGNVFLSPPELKEDYDILAYAYIEKNLKFKNSFTKLEIPLIFKNSQGVKKLNSFGCTNSSIESYKIRSQVSVLYYSATEQVIKLIPNSDKDEIFLAKIPPKSTLLETYNYVQDKIGQGERESQNKTFGNSDILKIPNIDFNIDHKYEELQQKKILNKKYLAQVNDPRYKIFGHYIKEARQKTKFKLDEKGAILKSGAYIDCACGGNPHQLQPIPKIIIFDQPFLIYLKEKQSKNPYLVIWIDNPELLQEYIAD